MNGLNLSNIQDAKLGGTQVSAIYFGSNKIWEYGHDYSQDYLTIESLEDNNTIYWYKNSEDLSSLSIQWSSDKNTWNSSTSTTGGTAITTLNTGDKIYVLGGYTAYAASAADYHYFYSTYNVNLSGNIMSLLYPTNFSDKTTLQNDYTFVDLFRSLKVVDASNLILPATTLTDSCYREMFKGCSRLNAPPVLPATTLSPNCYRAMFSGCAFTDAPELPATTLADYCYYFMFEKCTSLATAPALPATTLSSYCYQKMFTGCTSLTTAPVLSATTLAPNCYRAMFENCTSLATAPALPATTLSSYCYYYMFNGCTSLATAPALPATTLSSYCYGYMFNGCTSLTTAPELPATKLVTYCYRNMFYVCTSLSYIKCLATNISASNSHANWVQNVAASGTFVKPASMTGWPSGSSGIPSGWTVVNV